MGSLTEGLGRPPIPIDWEKVDRMLQAGSNSIEIAAELKIHPDTLCSHIKEKFSMTFTAYSARMHSKGEGMLRLAQFEKAIEGNIQMLLFLGRVRLKQVEAQPERNQDVPPNEDHLLLKDENIRLKHKIRMLEENAQSEARTELS